jgi:radical SAM superfamily enzyme YgiQ (UPF0313 family)
MPLKVLLVNAPNEVVNRNASNYACYPHIGIVQLATAVRARFGDRRAVEVIDGGISRTDEVQERVARAAPDVLGISALTPTYGEALKIAQTGKRAGSTVVLGDDHAGFFPELILGRRPAVDYVVANDMGEQPFAELIACLLGERHVENARGCENGRRRCTYCSIADLSVNTGTPKAFWRTIEAYHSAFGINLFFEVYDSFTASPRYVDALIEEVPPGLRRKLEEREIELMVYARALGLTKRDNVEKCRRLGVARVNTGLDAADPEMLEAQRKNKTTDQTNLDAIRRLNQAGISVHASYIAGAPGETPESLARTIAGIRRMLGEVELASVEFSRFIPLPNSPAWDILTDAEEPAFFKDRADVDRYLDGLGIDVPRATRRELADRYAREDLLDINELAEVWLEHFTHVDGEHALAQIAEVDDVVTQHNVRTGKNAG